MKRGRQARAVACVAAVAATLISSSRATAEARARVALVATDRDDPIVARIGAELAALGIEVVAAPPAGGRPLRDELDHNARSVGAFAAVRIVPTQAGVEVWVADRVTGKTTLREVVVPPEHVDDAPQLVALRTVELLRASLLELQEPHPPRGDVAPPPEARTIAKPTPIEQAPPAEVRTSFGLGAGVTASPGGIGPSGGVLVSASHASRRAGLHAFALVPVAPSRVEAAEGSATISPFVAGVGGDLALFPRREAWSASAGGGVGGTWLRMDGSAASGYEGTTDHVVVALPYARVSAAYAPSPRVAVRLDLVAGVGAPRPVVRFAGREVASGGRPLVLAALTLELSPWP